MDSLKRDYEKAASASDSLNEQEILQNLIDRLQVLRQRVTSDPNAFDNSLASLAQSVRASNARIAERHKEWQSSLTRLGKNIDKRFTADLTPLLPSAPPVTPPDAPAFAPAAPLVSDLTAFNAHASTSRSKQDPFEHMYFASCADRVNTVIAQHLLRQGHYHVANSFCVESRTPFPVQFEEAFQKMHVIADDIRNENLRSVLDWCQAHEPFLLSRDSDLLFVTQRYIFARLLFSDSVPLPDTLAFAVYPVTQDAQAHSVIRLPTRASDKPAISNGASLALAYAMRHFKPLYARHHAKIASMITAALFTPLERLLNSPYYSTWLDELKSVLQDVPRSGATPAPAEAATGKKRRARPALQKVVDIFTREYCARLKVSRDLPLVVATDIGGGGALARIAKVRSVMKEKRNEWSQVEELPIEIALPSQYRFHSVFACPVSKEQATEDNPPMMMPCGHVVAKESLSRLSKGSAVFKCPYCPVQSSVASATRVHF
ncbi:uncharacterized protein L969DRAFT_96349 [Mixia osmundae IAM 14324]|uniref:GID complex catalytic subunit 2 n=1 Tax=Mixia osmundae (strain CBS 9802 / IAM 14324 / JCM 22182 / KY 12970) TaxID=764103 RepID=G7DUZ7_MIXOS|nr:uncharacterized protein L969DRAFT_96349 [Mixia osmundae IAM 14324]KEI37260.1 hypothetical protein L969DRAFT_96349 [Mixia osmundae IAM 14324]GAA94407.1 hypothetical protein E5Q_01059 [Mixia osmundae IAM 14324]